MDYFIAYRKLSPEEEIDHRNWAKENYKPGQDIDGRWHPTVQDECVKINFNYISIGLTNEEQDIINNES
jgi:hypothetical protein